ncbi:MAG: EF-P lysine aminoacylase EpmA [Pseudomonadota bacterium]
MSISCWQPSCSLQVLQARAELYKTIRQFFQQRNVLEVETPVLGKAATVDPYIESLCTEIDGVKHYLQTSPEFFLKRLLAAGSGDIYALGKVFRQGEQGPRHRPEFTMLEWYRLGWDEQLLIQEVILLLEQCAGMPLRVSSYSYRELFLAYLSIDPHSAEIDQLKRLSQQYIEGDFNVQQRSAWLDLLMTHIIEPGLPEHIVVIYDYPEDQAALARVQQHRQSQALAKRFEVYWKKMELANGYWELTNAEEQLKRFERDSRYRRQHGLSDYPFDQLLVEALQQGMPDCAGVALGVDRLLMLLTGLESIDQVVSFTD